MTMTKTFDVGVRSPVSRQAQVLLGRADALLSESIGERDAGDRFLGSYIAALKGAAAVLASLPNSIGSRPRSRNAWVLMAKAAPDLAIWSEYFSSFSQPARQSRRVPRPLSETSTPTTSIDTSVVF